jgi:hypothetical protein
MPMIDIKQAAQEAPKHGAAATTGRAAVPSPPSRPWTVTGAFWMALVGTVAAIASNVFELKKAFSTGGASAASDLVITIVFIAMFAYFAEMMRKGRQWGRVILTVFAALGLVFNTLGLLHLGGRPIDGFGEVSLAIIGNVASVIGMWWMFARSANAWFRAVRASSREVSTGMRKAMLTAHIAISVGWLGLIVGMVALAIVGAISGSSRTQYSIYTIMTLLDEIFLGMTSFFALLTGLIGAIGTKWHLMRRRWISTKFVATLCLMCFGFGVNHPLIAKATALVEAGASPAQVSAVGVPLAWCAGAAAALLIFMTILSTYKPWGFTRYGKRKLAESGRAPRPSVLPTRPKAVTEQREAA